MADSTPKCNTAGGINYKLAYTIFAPTNHPQLKESILEIFYSKLTKGERNLIYILLLTVFCLFDALGFAAPAAPSPSAQWIWSSDIDIAPKNRFTYFRKVIVLPAVPTDATIRFAADSNAQLWINGEIVRRKVSRYFEEKITAEVIDAVPYLHPGKNVILALHHNWGDIIVFQRSGNKHAGLWLEGFGIRTDASWKCITAPEFLAHEKQSVGLIGDARIRYPQVVDGGKRLAGNFSDPAYDDSGWKQAVTVTGGPWPARPGDVETPGQRESPVRPLSVLNAGSAVYESPISDDPFSMAAAIHSARLTPDKGDVDRASGHLTGKELVIEGKAGSARYITFEYGRPVHGYPFLKLAEATPGVVFDFGYCEIPLSIYDGSIHLRSDGWINPEGVVGMGYGDRYITAGGAQEVELPDERTVRWMAIHIRFPKDGRVTILDIGMVKSQYPIKLIGSFSCGEERIDQIVKLCIIHAELTMSDSYVDTPGREDGQWIEDARPRARISAHWFGDNMLRRFLIRTYAQSQGPDGDFHPFPPSNYPAYPSFYDWSVQWVATLYDDYLWTGKTDMVRAEWNTLRKYWDNVLSRMGEDGIWRSARILADIRIGIHCQDDSQSSGMVTPWIIERLKWSAEMADAVNQGEQARKWRADAERMTAAFLKFHVIPTQGNIPTHVGDRLDTANLSLERGYSQAGQTVAIMTDLLPPAQARADMDYAFTAPVGAPPPGVTRWNNPSYFYRALTALSRVGMTDRAMAHFVERFSPYLPGNPNNHLPLELQGPYGGPIPEYWVSREDLNLKEGEKDTPQPADCTGSHGWGACPLLWLHESILGITITRPGGGKIRIAPDSGGLPYVEGHSATPKGMVWVHWEPRVNHLEVDIPAGVIAEVAVPRDRTGKRLATLSAAGRVTPAGEGNVTIHGAGTYKFTVR
ncbi:MAG: alpha-L-rhamnosidase C-terminal domain-containing protein [Candidatus Latescibacterota bacterium]